MAPTYQKYLDLGGLTNHRKFIFTFFVILFIFRMSGILYADEKNVVPLLLAGGGSICDKKYANWMFQIQYKSSRYLWHRLRPQITFLQSKPGSGFVGLGLGWELYITKHFVITPSFTPGIYWRGRGKNLGCPLEFRSVLEVAYEMKNQIRIGLEVFHVSNAHLSHRNPGFNAITLNLSIPLPLLHCSSKW